MLWLRWSGGAGPGLGSSRCLHESVLLADGAHGGTFHGGLQAKSVASCRRGREHPRIPFLTHPQDESLRLLQSLVGSLTCTGTSPGGRRIELRRADRRE